MMMHAKCRESVMKHNGTQECCRDSIFYRLILAYFMAHDNWASQHNITIMSRMILHIMSNFPAMMCQTYDTFLL